MFYQAYSNTLKHHDFLSALRFKVQASLFEDPNSVAFGSLFKRTSSLQFSICHGKKFGPAVSSSLTLCSLNLTQCSEWLAQINTVLLSAIWLACSNIKKKNLLITTCD